jgi:hypothetical protein
MRKSSFKNQTGSMVRPEKTWTEGLTGFLRVTGPTNKKPEKLHKNYVFSQGYDLKPRTLLQILRIRPNITFTTLSLWSTMKANTKYIIWC